jgi:hypothetical protein
MLKLRFEDVNNCVVVGLRSMAFFAEIAISLERGDKLLNNR